jgi:hypothetical protein
MKFLPVTVTVVGVVVPVKTSGGDSVKGPIGAGLFTGTVMAVDVPPPGTAFTAVNDRLPVLATSEALSVTLTCVGLTKIVVRALPFTSIVVSGTKPVPTRVRVGDAAPAISADGVNSVMTGEGLVTWRFTAAPEPLLVLPFSAMTESCAPLASWVGDTVAVTWLLLT